ncbi:thiopeptide-type bacteriocin biosynthesis protein [Thomasclavelia cocleata]|uniref:thiopeptide-type bacteriocin biosynthesis protein n=1 Tax=Thomasclavelia cocleata TaxID=69824 RepID=UPI003C6F57DE
MITLFETQIINDVKEINLREYQDDFDLNPKSEENDIWTAGELIFDALYNSRGQLKNICLNTEIGSNVLGNLGGRFYSKIGMENEVQNYFNTLSKSESYEFAKVIYDYPDRKSENVDSYLNVPKYICLNKLVSTSTNQYISIKDIGLIVENKHIFLFDINTRKRIAITNLNSLNPQNGNLLLQLICYVGEQNELVQKIEYLKNIHDKFTPELTVKWGNITLFPAIIKFNKSTILKKLKDGKSDEVMNFLNSRLDVKASDFLYYCGQESEYVDFLNPISVQSFINTLSQSTQEIVVFKTIKHKENDYTCQFVMGYDNKKYTRFLNNSEIKKIIPKKANFNQILYFKIYIHDYLEDSYIKSSLNKMISYLKNNFSNYDGSFFIRYKELEHHIRLRIFLKNRNRTAVEQYVIDTLENDKFVDKFEICSFFPEVSRYGGNKGWNYYAKYLRKESDLILNLTDHSGLASALYLGLNIIDIFGADKHVKNVISNFSPSQQIKAEIRENKNLIINQIKEINKFVSSSVELTSLHKSWLSELSLYNSYIKTLSLFDQRYILDSIIHMLCNRIFGISKQKEKRFWLYLNSVLGYYKYSGQKLYL